MFVAIKQRSKKMINIVLVLVMPKEKLVAMNWMSTVCRKEVVVKDKV